MAKTQGHVRAHRRRLRAPGQRRRGLDPPVQGPGDPDPDRARARVGRREGPRPVYGTDAWVDRAGALRRRSRGPSPAPRDHGIECVGCKRPVREGPAAPAAVLLQRAGRPTATCGSSRWASSSTRSSRPASSGCSRPTRATCSRCPTGTTSSSGWARACDTTYDPEPGDKYEVDFPPEDELHDIAEILDRALRGGGRGARPGTVRPRALRRPRPRPRTRAGSLRARRRPPSPSPRARSRAAGLATRTSEDDLGKAPSEEDIDDASTEGDQGLPGHPGRGVPGPRAALPAGEDRQGDGRQAAFLRPDA